MGKMNFVTVRSRRGHWSQVKQTFARWRQAAHSRAELRQLSDRVLKDIGVSRCTDASDASRSFWIR
jgi:uncharacterized protein YjiS (DUF1127 family)